MTMMMMMMMMMMTTTTTTMTKMLDGILVHYRVTPSSKTTGTLLYTWVKRGTMRVKCLAQEHNAVLLLGLEPRPLDAEWSALAIRPPYLPNKCRPNVDPIA